MIVEVLPFETESTRFRSFEWHGAAFQQYKEAEVDLELALKHCNREARSNKRRILNNLIPLRLRLGETRRT